MTMTRRFPRVCPECHNEIVFNAGPDRDRPWCDPCGSYSVVRVVGHTLPYYQVLEGWTGKVLWTVVGDCASGPLAHWTLGEPAKMRARMVQVGEAFRTADDRIGMAIVKLVGGDILGWYGPTWEVPGSIFRTSGFEQVHRLECLDCGSFLASKTPSRVHSIRRVVTGA